VEPVNDRSTLLCLRAERAFLRLLNVDCNAPVGLLATIDNCKLKMRAQFFDGESDRPRVAEGEGESETGESLAGQLVNRLRAGDEHE
jgi:hydroxymethylbilane synthase